MDVSITPAPVDPEESGRRRRRRIVVLAAVAVLVVAGGTVAVAAPRGHHRHVGRTATPATTGPVRTVAMPATTPPRLPASTPSIKGLALAQATPAGPVLMYDASGRWYDTGIAGDFRSTGNYPALSPDFHRLVSLTGGTSDLWDMSTGTHVTVPDRRLIDWSLYGHYALLAGPVGVAAGAYTTLTRLDLASGARQDLDTGVLLNGGLSPKFTVLGRIRDDGDILLPVPSGAPHEIDLASVDPTSGAIAHRAPLGQYSMPWQGMGVHVFRIVGNGGAALVCTAEHSSILIDLGSGSTRPVTGLGSFDMLIDYGDQPRVQVRAKGPDHRYKAGEPVRVDVVDPVHGTHRTVARYQVDIRDGQLFTLAGEDTPRDLS